VSDARQLVFPPFTFDTSNECLLRGSDKVSLRPKSLAVLRYFLENPHSVVSKDKLKLAVWPRSQVVDAALKVSILDIRKALGDSAAHPKYIETVGQSGYRFIAPVSFSFPSEPGISSAFHVVGRQSELQLLRRHLDMAGEGKRQIVFVTGEPGIGKTTLVEVFSQTFSKDVAMVVTRGQCIEQYGAAEAYMPILDVLDRLCRGAPGQDVIESLRGCAPSWLASLPALIGTEERAELERQNVGIAPERRLREIGAFFEDIAKEQTVVLILEDLHWLDPSSLALISFLARRREAARLMLIGTYRSGEVERHNVPLKHVKEDLELHGYCKELPLKLLDRAAVGEYLAARFESPAVSNSVISTVYRRSEGNPLFMVNVTDYLLGQDAIVRQNDAVTLADIKANEIVPGTIRDLIERQVDALPAEDRDLLETASVAGTTFSVSAVARALGGAREIVEEQCRSMADREQFLQFVGSRRSPSGNVTARYSFLHALYQNVIYDQVGEARKARLHQSIGERIEAVYQGATEQVAAELAQHFERAGDNERAVKYLLQSAQRAMRQNAYREALAYCENGLERLKFVPKSEQRDELEISFQLLTGVSSASSQGFASAQGQVAFAEARALSSRITNKALLFQTLGGLWSYHLLRGDLRESLKIAKAMLVLARRCQDWSFLLNAHMVAGCSHFYLGDFARAREDLDYSVSHYDLKRFAATASAYSWDPGVLAACYNAKTLWMLGYPMQAAQQAQRALDFAHQLSSPYYLALANGVLAMYYAYRGDVDAMLRTAEAAIATATDHGFYHWLAAGTTIKGCALAQKGQRSQGMSCLNEGIAKWQSTGAQMLLPTFRLLQVEMHLAAGDGRAALTIVEDGLAISKKNRESYYDAELYRLKGEILSRTSLRNPKGSRKEQAELYFLRAVQTAHRQKAKSLQLKATMSLCRLWQETGKEKEAQQTLREIYGWYTEGFDTPDLEMAKKLLEELS
jgi:DNA-binding winged helix-turn-helix (wHTH) protein/predicted ATPase